MASVESLDALFNEELKDVYDAEKQLTKTLPKMAKKASSEELRQAIEEHQQQTEEHVERLERGFDELDLPARAKRCKGIRGIIEEGDEMVGEAESEQTRDALIIAAAQKVEHYEIATYGTLRTWASILGHDNVASILEETLNEEKETDQRLTELAEAFVNESAAGEEGEEKQTNQRGRRGGAQAREARGGSTSRSRRQVPADRTSGGRKSSRSR